jgi:hypothetical protein
MESFPQFIPLTCGDGSTLIAASLINETDALQNEVYETPVQDYCDINGTLLECQLDFANYSSHEIQSGACRNVSGLYLEIDYSLLCNHSTTSEEMTISGTHDPLCISDELCNYDDHLPFAEAHVHQTWMELGWVCETTNLAVEDFTPSSSPTISQSPTMSMAPTIPQTISHQPSQSMAPSEAPSLYIPCLDATITLNQTQLVANETEAIQAAIEKKPFDSYCTFPNDITFASSNNDTFASSNNDTFASSNNDTFASSNNDTFASSNNDTFASSNNDTFASPNNDTFASSNNDTVASPNNSVTCEIDYSAIENNMIEICAEEGGAYVENTYTISCYGENNTDFS